MNELSKLQSNQTMSSIEIAELTSKRHHNVIRDIESMLKELDLGELKFDCTYETVQGKKAKCYKLPKRECLILVSGYSVALRSKIIDRWQELEQINKVDPYTLSDKAQAALIAAEGAARIMRLSNSATNLLVSSAIQPYLPNAQLPAYSIDAPISIGGEISQSSKPTDSAMSLLRNHGSKLSSMKFNKLAHAKGYIEQLTRKSSKGLTKKFWTITEKGKEFGKNMTHSANQKETYPCWYRDSFGELLSKVGAN